MTLRRTIVMVAVILAGILAIPISKVFGGNADRVMQALLFLFAGLLIAGFIWRKHVRK